MSKKDLVDAVAAAADITKEKAAAAVDAITAHIEATLKAGDDVGFPPLGKFKVSKRDARTGRNPATGATVQIAASRSVKFQASKGLKDTMN
jgi:DNA-binding protein HU-beta